MILRGQSRTGWKSLADHLMKTEKNERVEVLQVRGTISEDLHESLEEMEALAVGTRCKRVLYHASFSPAPGEQLTAEQWQRCADVLAAEFEMEQHARAIVLHTKAGEQHAHVVLCRIDPETMKAAHDGHNYARNETVSRQLEREFGLQRVQGVFAERELDSPRAERTPELWEMQQRHTTEIDPRQFRKEMRELLAEGDGVSFVAALPERGVTLCRGDRRDFVLVDAGGGMHSLSRAVGLKAAEVRELLEAVDREALPSVAEARQAVEQTRQLERPVEVRERLERLVADSSPGVGEPRRSNERHVETAEAGAEGSERAERLREERELAAAAIKAAWQGAEHDPVSFVVSLGEQGLTLAENEKGRFVAVDERGAVHALSGAALGEKPWEVQRELQLAFKSEGSVQLPGVAEVRQELREARDAERAESALGWAAHRRAEAWDRAAQWEENRAIWKEQRQLDRQIDRVEAAQERPQSAAIQAIGRAYAESRNGAELVAELEWRGFMVCRVSAEEAERSQRQRAVLGTTPSYQEGEVLAMTERGHAYRINAETIAMTATNTYDHVQNVSERLASIEPQDVLSLSQAQEVVTQQANERGSIPTDRFEQLPSAWEIGRGAEAAVDAAEGVASKGVEVVIAFGEGLANLLEGSLGGGAIRKAPGGAEYVPPAAAGPPPPLAVTKPPWLEKQEKLRTTSGVEAAEDPAVKGKVEEKQGQSFNEQFEDLRRRNAKAAQERAELYRDRDDDGDRDRER